MQLNRVLSFCECPIAQYFTGIGDLTINIHQDIIGIGFPVCHQQFRIIFGIGRDPLKGNQLIGIIHTLRHRRKNLDHRCFGFHNNDINRIEARFVFGITDLQFNLGIVGSKNHITKGTAIVFWNDVITHNFIVDFPPCRQLIGSVIGIAYNTFKSDHKTFKDFRTRVMRYDICGRRWILHCETFIARTTN